MSSIIWSALALVVSLVGVGVAVWQGKLSRLQLDLATETERRTEASLQEIRSVANETKRTVSEIKANVDERLNRIVDDKLAADRQSTALGQDAARQLVGAFLSKVANPSGQGDSGTPKGGESQPDS